MYQIRIHGRGGEGGKTAARILSTAAFLEGKEVQDFSVYGAERRGAPVVSFCRINNKKILVRGYVHEPDAVLVLDDTLPNVVDVEHGLKPNGIMLINSPKPAKEFTEDFETKAKVHTVDATQIALDVIGKPIPNATILGGFVKLTNIVKLESLKKGITEEVHGKKAIRDKNIKSAVKCYGVVK
jgi:pyruvate ferredoxin oxidoreductase gamma subunit